MREEDQPPQEIWLDDEALNAHFERVKARYSTSSDVESVPDADFDQNELTKGLRRGSG